MQFEKIPEEFRAESYSQPITSNFSNELDSIERDRVKRYNHDSDLPRYINKGIVSVHGDSEELEKALIQKTEKKVAGSEMEGYSELEKAVMLGELGISPQVHGFSRPDQPKRDYRMDFLTDYTNFHDKSFDGIKGMEPYAEATGYIMGALNELELVHGDLIKPRPQQYSHGSASKNNFVDTPLINNMLVGDSSGDVKLIDPEVTRFHDETGTGHQWRRGPISYDLIEQDTPDPETETENVWTGLISEALDSTQMGQTVSREDLLTEVEGREGWVKVKTDVTGFLEDKSTQQDIYQVENGVPRFEFEDVTISEYFEDPELAGFAKEVGLLTQEFRTGFEDGRSYVRGFDWPAETDGPEQYLEELTEALK